MSISVLLIDDEPDAGELFRQNFRREIRKGDITIVFVTSAEHALTLMDRDDSVLPTVILSDIMMPGISGIEFLDQIKPRWPNLPIYMISAFGGSDLENSALQKGADGFFSKPVDFPNLSKMLKNRFGNISP